MGFKLWHLAHDAKAKKKVGSAGVCKLKQTASNCLATSLVCGDDRSDVDELVNISRVFLSTAEAWRKESNVRLADSQYKSCIALLDRIGSRQITGTGIIKDILQLQIKALSGQLSTALSTDDEEGAITIITRLQTMTRNTKPVITSLDQNVTNAPVATPQYSINDEESAKDILTCCYKWAKSNYQSHKYDKVIKWLEICTEFNVARGVNFDKKQQAVYYGMLADVHLNGGRRDEAKKCIDLATRDSYNPNVECLRIKYDLMVNNYESACEYLTKLVQDPTPVSIGLVGAQLVSVHHNVDLCAATASNAFADLLRRIKKSMTDNVYPPEYSSIRMEWLVLLLRPTVFSKQTALAQRLIDSIIADHDNSTAKLNNNHITRLCSLLCECGGNAIESKRYEGGVDWYARAYRILPVDDRENRAKCMSMVAVCRIKMNQLDEAMIAIKGASELNVSVHAM